MNMESLFTVLSNFWGYLHQQDAGRILLSMLASPFSFMLIPKQLIQVYFTEANYLYSAFLICIVSILTCYIVSVFTGNWSQVDRVWSILPVVYAWHFLVRSGAFRPDLSASLYSIIPEAANHGYLRAYVMTAFVTIWGLRLSYNFFRKGGYQKGHEDYRWPIVRNTFGWNPVNLQLFNFFFISAYQNILIFLFSVPIYGAVIRPSPLNVADYFLFGLWITLFGLEVSADQQQWTFQNLKYRFIKAGRPLLGEYADGFIQTGFFKFSRHPNFFAEISMWWTYWLIQAYSCTGIYNWLLLGPVLLTALFHASTDFTERQSVLKYPKYAHYQKQVSRLIPWFPVKS